MHVRRNYFKQLNIFWIGGKLGKIIFLNCQVIVVLYIYGRISFNASKGLLHVFMPTHIHSGCMNWLIDWISTMKQSEEIEKDGMRLFIEATLKGFMGPYNGR
jgi:hypothetical protein